ncbi:MAG: DUF1566 domain-containing protein [Pseudomonadota bacterium]
MKTTTSLPTIGFCALFLVSAGAHAFTCINNIPPSNPDSIYMDHGDGTVTDTRTGLMWKKCNEGLSGADCSTGSAQVFTWNAALVYAEAHNFAGYDDWRMPSVKELRSLVELCRNEPAYNTDVFFDMNATLLSGVPDVLDPDQAWAVNFDYGLTTTVSRGDDYRVHLVRGGQPSGPYVQDGLCGTAQGVATLTTPSSGLCATGSAGGVTGAASAFTWSCAGSNGGATASCAAPRQYEVTPQAGANGSLSPATVQAVTYGTTTAFTVTPATGYALASVDGCGGSLSGDTYTTGAIVGTCTVDATFSATPVTGSCGAAQGVARLTAPNSGLCASGTPGSLSSAAGTHAWICQGANGGSDAACSAQGAAAQGGSGTVTLSVAGGSCVIDTGSSAPVTPPPGLPTGVSLPYGALGFTLNGCGTGGSATVSVSYSGNVDGLSYWKYLGGSWSTIPATVSGHTAVFTLVDGGPYDADGAADGSIQDPGGPGQGVAPVPGPLPWGLALMAGLLGLIGLGARRRLMGRLAG